MWRKSEDRNLKFSAGALSSPDHSPQQPSAAVSSDSSTALAMWSQLIKIKGEISGPGDFFLDGAFEGKVYIPDGAFTVGPNARVTAEIEAREIIVRGEVTGTLKAYERVQILSTGRVIGDMDTRGIMVEEGAVLHGKVAIPLALPQAVAPEADSTAVASPEAVAPTEVLSEVRPETLPENLPKALPETDQAPPPSSPGPSRLAKRAAAS